MEGPCWERKGVVGSVRCNRQDPSAPHAALRPHGVPKALWWPASTVARVDHLAARRRQQALDGSSPLCCGVTRMWCARFVGAPTLSVRRAWCETSAGASSRMCVTALPSRSQDVRSASHRKLYIAGRCDPSASNLHRLPSRPTPYVTEAFLPLRTGRILIAASCCDGPVKSAERGHCDARACS